MRIKKGALSWPAKTAGAMRLIGCGGFMAACAKTHTPEKQFPQLRKLRDGTSHSLFYFLRGSNSPRTGSLY